MQVDSKIICPECKAESTVPTGGVKDLSANSFISNIIHEEADKVLKCNECVEDEPVVAYCQTCSSYFCQICCEHHKRNKRFSKHITVTVTKLRSNKNVNFQPKAISLTCKEHDIEILFYCETCEQLICEQCGVKNHCDHNYANAIIQTCKCEIKLRTASPGERVVENLSQAHDTKDEIKKVAS